MATSGTIGSTVIDNVKVIDHAVRRCGLVPATLTPEQLEASLNNLFFILAALSNRGVNLWCIEKEIVALSENKATYFLAPGTIDVMSVNYRSAVGMTHTVTNAKDSYKATFASAVPIKTIGIYYNVTREHDWIVEVSNDGTTWSTMANLGTVLGFAGNWSWHDIDPSYSTLYLRLRDTRPDPQNNFPSLNVDIVRLINTTSEVPLAPMSRDTYNSLSDKRSPGRPVQYYFNKHVIPELVLWPEPNDVTSHLVVRKQRQVQDVGAMQDALDIPNRWFEHIIWRLAANLAYELPNVEEKRRLECAAFASTTLTEAENGETDGSPFFLQPKISGYTK